jgi:outer membrane protein assembly factor BamB
VAVGENRLYFGSRDGFLYCLSLTGQELGRWNAHAPIVTSPALSGGYVYLVTATGKLYGLKADDLELTWEATLGFTGPFLSSPAVARGHIYVGSKQDGLMCLGAPGARLEPRWAGLLGGPGQGGTIDNQPLPEKGKFAWRFPLTEDTERVPDLQVAAPPACLGGCLYVPTCGGRKGVVCLRDDLKGNAPPTEAWFAPSEHGVSLSPAATMSEVFFVDGSKGEADRRLYCLGAAEGRPRWTLPVATDASGAFVLLDDGGLIVDESNRLTFFRDSGEIGWRVSVGAVVGVPAWSDALVVVAVAQPPALLVLDRPTGKTLWHLPLDGAPTAPPVLRRGRITLGTPAGVAAFRLRDGERLWQAATGPPTTPLVQANNHLAYVNAAGELVILGAEDGRLVKTLPGALPGLAPLAPPRTLVYADKNGLQCCSQDGVETRSWMGTNWLGRLTCSPVLADSRIYVGTLQKGLVCLKGKESR